MDMGFVKKIGKDPKRDAIVISIIDMAHRMGMGIVAEGIENKQQQSEFYVPTAVIICRDINIINQCLQEEFQSCWINNEKQQKTASVK